MQLPLVYLLLAFSPLLWSPAPVAAPAPAPQDPVDAQSAAELLAQAGIALELDQKRLSIPATVVVRNELLEFLLVAPHGALHEALFQTEVDVELLQAAFLTLGLQDGKDAAWAPKDPPPSEAELAEGVLPYEVLLPEGDGLYIYAGWRTDDETYFFRVEDLLRNLDTQRAMRRHPWVYLGSRMVETRGGEVFAAAAEGNLINVTFFKGGSSSLMTAALEGCANQSIWLANPWLLPPTGSQVRLIFSRNKLDSWPAEGEVKLPEVDLAGEGAR